jgi:hypothetical protein
LEAILGKVSETLSSKQNTNERAGSLSQVTELACPTYLWSWFNTDERKRKERMKREREEGGREGKGREGTISLAGHSE